MISVKNLTKTFGYETAVNDISFEISKGEIVGLLGPNGAGKSTTMKMIAGFLIPDFGEVLYNKKNISRSTLDFRKKLGYMPESNPLYSEMLVRDAINYSLKLHFVSKEKREERLNFVIDSIGLESVVYKPISQLSKGYRQRVGLAMAISHDPEILILDEPTEGLDPNQRKEIRNLIRDLSKDRTILLSTHVMQEVEAMCNRLIVINNGEIVLDGKKSSIIKKELETDWIRLAVEGSKVASEIKKLVLEKYTRIGRKTKPYKFRIKVSSQEKFIEDFSKLALKNKWTIHELVQEKRGLEDLFGKLTTQKNTKQNSSESKKTKVNKKKKNSKKLRVKFRKWK